MLLKNVDAVVLASFVENYRKNNRCESGVSSFFVRINNKFGIKFYSSEELRDECYNTQKILSVHNLAPNTYGKLPPISIRYYDDVICIFYGYLTEVVTVLKTVEIPYEIHIRQQRIHSSYTYGNISWSEYKNLIMKSGYKREIPRKKLKDKLRNIGFEFHDSHDGNIGIKNGQYVCIDPELERID